MAALGGRFVRPRPIIAVTLIGPLRSLARDCLLDTAADEIVFPEHLARGIGTDLSATTPETSHYVRFGSITVRRAVIALRLTDGVEIREWSAIASFTPSRLIYPILGFAGCLQFFDATFRGAIEEVELTTNALYPGV